MSTLDALGIAFSCLLSAKGLMYVFLGSVFGLLYGAAPGLGGVAAISMLLPFVYGMDVNNALLLIMGTAGAVPFGGSITSILLNTPGTPTNAATCFDGFPMTQNGEAGRALGISSVASCLGAVFGVICLIIAMPFFKAISLKFGPPEFFMLVLFGVCCIAVASRGNIVKGLAAGGLGLSLALVGFCSFSGEVRLGFGTMYLYEGFDIVPVVIGLFSIAQMFTLGETGKAIAPNYKTTFSNVLEGVKDIFRYFGCFIRSSLVGVGIGILPGVGGATANFLSYLFAKQFSKTPEKFGTGHPEGVIASESSNNAKDGGSLIPTLAFGIPGSAITAVLIGALVMLGIRPGPHLMRDYPDMVWVIILALVTSNIIASSFGLALANVIAKVTRIEPVYLIPAITSLCLVGAFVLEKNILDVATAIVFGFLAYGLRKFGYSAITFVIGFVLGDLVEKNFFLSLSMNYNNYSIFFTRGISLTIFILIILSLMLPSFTNWRNKKKEGKGVASC
ncbi:hypothetical protein DCMF_01940 [Candidatus Formimonas warabiya]|uniref:DUF112 domain-containing protein n=2 Tax=Formimonas warabiya TaxID=1761012 RepID=A0A3G1KMM7_FORW1|nr:hypothetical protein DCMF_01940 [Candidatus Formimonas warabiya]